MEDDKKTVERVSFLEAISHPIKFFESLSARERDIAVLSVGITVLVMKFFR